MGGAGKAEGEGQGGFGAVYASMYHVIMCISLSVYMYTNKSKCLLYATTYTYV